MFTEPEVVKFTESDDLFRYIICKTNDNIDMSIFTESEWEKLMSISQSNRKKQHELEDLTDYSYTWFFDLTKTNSEENSQRQNPKEFMDEQLEKAFGIKFSDLEPKFGTRKELRKIFEILDFQITDKTVTKDQVRKWFVDNYPNISYN